MNCNCHPKHEWKSIHFYFLRYSYVTLFSLFWNKEKYIFIFIYISDIYLYDLYILAFYTHKSNLNHVTVRG